MDLRREDSISFINLIYQATRDPVMHNSILTNVKGLLKCGYVNIDYVHQPGPLLNALQVTINNGAFYWTKFLLQKGANPLLPFQLDDHIYYIHFTLPQLRILLLFGLPPSVIMQDLHLMNASIRKYMKKNLWPKEALLYVFKRKGLNCFYFA